MCFKKMHIFAPEGSLLLSLVSLVVLPISSYSLHVILEIQYCPGYELLTSQFMPLLTCLSNWAHNYQLTVFKLQTALEASRDVTAFISGSHLEILPKKTADQWVCVKDGIICHGWQLKYALILTLNWTWANIYSDAVIKPFYSNHQNWTTMKLKFNSTFSGETWKKPILFLQGTQKERQRYTPQDNFYDSAFSFLWLSWQDRFSRRNQFW